jgi:hypothetical protein
MTKRISAIIATLHGSMEQKSTFQELPLDAQTKVVHDAVVYNVWRAQATQERIESNGSMSAREIEEYKASGRGKAATAVERTEYIIAANNRRKLDASEIKELNDTAKFFEVAALNQMHFLQSVAHYVEAGDSHIEFENGSFNAEVGYVENDTAYAPSVATAKHPHAWARARLITKGLWPMVTDETSGEILPALIQNPQSLSQESFDVVSQRVAGQLISAIALSIHNIGEYAPARTAARDLQIAATSPSMFGLGALKSQDALTKALMTLSVANPAFNETKGSMGTIWRNMIALDKDDAQVAVVEDAVKEVTTSIQDLMLDIRKQIAIDMGKEQIAKLGASPEIQAKAVKLLEAKFLTPVVKAEPTVSKKAKAKVKTTVRATASPRTH